MRVAIDEGHGAGAAIAFGAALFRSCSPGLTQEIEERGLRVYAANLYSLTVERELERVHCLIVIEAGDLRNACIQAALVGLWETAPNESSS